MEQRETELAVHELLLKGLDALDMLTGGDWAAHVESMCEALVRLDPEVDRTLASVVRACAVIQQLLLDLVLPPPSGPSRPAIVDCASRLLCDLHTEAPELGLMSLVPAAGHLGGHQ